MWRERCDPALRSTMATLFSGLPYGDRELSIPLCRRKFLRHVEWEMAVVALKDCMRVGKRSEFVVFRMQTSLITIPIWCIILNTAGSSRGNL